MKSAAKNIRKKTQREAARIKRQGTPGPVSEDEDPEVYFRPLMDCPDSPPLSPPAFPASQGEADNGLVLDMVENLKDKLSALNLDNDNISVACDALRQQCQDQGVADGDLTRLVKESLDGRPPQRPQTEAVRPHPIIRPDPIDDRGNLRAADIGIPWQGGDTFLHGVRVVGTNEDTHHLRPRPATSTPYSPVREHTPCIMSTPRSTHPVCLETPATPAHRTGQEGRQDRKLQTLIEVCTDFASLSHTTHVHRPAEQVFALEEDDDREEEMIAMVDRSQWNTQRAAEPPLSPELQQMFALARRMGYEMRPIARRSDAPRRTPGSPTSPDQGYSKIKCFSCGQMGHTQARCPKPDSSLPFRPGRLECPV